MGKIIADLPILLELDEPYEYGSEDNPFPLDAILRCVKIIEGRECGIVKTKMNYRNKVYVHGFVLNRYSGDDLKLSMLGNFRQLIVGASFLPVNHPAEKYLENCDFSVIPNSGSAATSSQIPWNEWSGFIGAVRIQE
jgi:hypothetical protein